MKCPVCLCSLDAMDKAIQDKHYELCNQLDLAELPEYSELGMVKRQLALANQIINEREKEILKLIRNKTDLSARLTQWTKEIDRLAEVVHKQNNIIAKHGILNDASEK